MTDPILTDSMGRPFERPELPGPDAPIEVKIAYIRAVHAYNDRIVSQANDAFDVAFRSALRK